MEVYGSIQSLARASARSITSAIRIHLGRGREMRAGPKFSEIYREDELVLHGDRRVRREAGAPTSAVLLSRGFC